MQGKYLFIAETDEEAWEIARPVVEVMAGHSHHLTKRVGPESKVVPVFESPEEFIERALIVGSPETALAKIRMFEAEQGISHFRFEVKIRQIALEHVRRSFRLFADEVLPQLEPEVLDGPAVTALTVGSSDLAATS